MVGSLPRRTFEWCGGAGVENLIMLETLCDMISILTGSCQKKLWVQSNLKSRRYDLGGFFFFLNMLLRKLNLRHSKSALTAVNSRFRGQFFYQYFIPVAVPARDRGVINHLHSAWNKLKMLLKRRVIFCVRMTHLPLPHLKQVLKSPFIHQFM